MACTSEAAKHNMLFQAGEDTCAQELERCRLQKRSERTLSALENWTSPLMPILQTELLRRGCRHGCHTRLALSLFSLFSLNSSLPTVIRVLIIITFIKFTVNKLYSYI